MAGNSLGSRDWYLYTTDADTVVRLQLDETLAEAADLDKATTATPGTPKPSRFKPRVVFWESDSEVDDVPFLRKEIVCNIDSELYATFNPQALTIDGVAGTVTGRRGEKVSFAKLSAPEEEGQGGGGQQNP